MVRSTVFPVIYSVILVAGGVFDPFGISKGDESILRKYKENEIKNGRLAMVRTMFSDNPPFSPCVPPSACVVCCVMSSIIRAGLE